MQPTDNDFLTWAQVNETHRTRRGIYQKGEHLISLLTDFGVINPCYPDALSDDGKTISYTGDGRRAHQGLSPANRALLNAIESAHTVPLFCKVAVSKWRHLGWWRVIDGAQIYDEREKRLLWRFTLRKSE